MSEISPRDTDGCDSLLLSSAQRPPPPLALARSRCAGPAKGEGATADDGARNAAVGGLMPFVDGDGFALSVRSGGGVAGLSRRAGRAAKDAAAGGALVSARGRQKGERGTRSGGLAADIAPGRSAAPRAAARRSPLRLQTPQRFTPRVKRSAGPPRGSGLDGGLVRCTFPPMQSRIRFSLVRRISCPTNEVANLWGSLHT
jgi:hypothetical protein